MTLHRSDYGQAARYLKYACELLEREAFGRTVAAREVLKLAVQRLSLTEDGSGSQRGLAGMAKKRQRIDALIDAHAWLRRKANKAAIERPEVCEIDPTALTVHLRWLTRPDTR